VVLSWQHLHVVADVFGAGAVQYKLMLLLVSQECRAGATALPAETSVLAGVVWGVQLPPLQCEEGMKTPSSSVYIVGGAGGCSVCQVCVRLSVRQKGWVRCKGVCACKGNMQTFTCTDRCRVCACM